ncbi:MAG: hypothetical protein V7676_04785 [Parasphingorhabdus sp.]|uniref:hypothetical protein n=1 Tax=Parasphingorhabdus sp. TaxID=2709688 RepID=UPI003001B92A
MLFLEALARTGNVRAAATYAGLSRESAYKLRRRPDALAFARAWDAAIIHARDVFQDELLDRGLNGWTEPVWYQGEEVGTRERWSAPLFLAALARLDKMADGVTLSNKTARAAADHFDALVEAIGQGSDCAELLEAIDAEAAPSVQRNKRRADGPSGADVMAQFSKSTEMIRINSMAPEDINVSDLDIAEREDWDDLQWERAHRSGLLERSGVFDDLPDPV